MDVLWIVLELLTLTNNIFKHEWESSILVGDMHFSNLPYFGGQLTQKKPLFSRFCVKFEINYETKTNWARLTKVIVEGTH